MFPIVFAIRCFGNFLSAKKFRISRPIEMKHSVKHHICKIQAFPKIRDINFKFSQNFQKYLGYQSAFKNSLIVS